MAEPATNAKKGNVLELDGRHYLVLDYQLVTPGNKRGFIQFKLKDLQSGATVTKKVGSNDQVEILTLDKQPCEYLYAQGELHVFMNKETYEQYEIPAADLESALPYMVHNQEVTLVFLEGRPISVELPAAVELEVAEAEEAIKGDTATNVTKRAVLETGLTVQVPHFIKAGERIKVDTRTGSFISRA
ncbi:MAG: elongation factor P [Planctomycetota bacterium]|nr:MAG: elongation factor P [Planctomycetota bacterium]